jgi:hypothetical protein
MTDAPIQTVLSVGIPTLAVLMGILINNSRLTDLRSHMDARFGDVNNRFDAIDRRFDDMRDMWRSELHRVEEVLDARLRHLEER